MIRSRWHLPCFSACSRWPRRWRRATPSRCCSTSSSQWPWSASPLRMPTCPARRRRPPGGRHSPSRHLQPGATAHLAHESGAGPLGLVRSGLREPAHPERDELGHDPGGRDRGRAGRAGAAGIHRATGRPAADPAGAVAGGFARGSGHACGAADATDGRRPAGAAGATRGGLAGPRQGRSAEPVPALAASSPEYPARTFRHTHREGGGAEHPDRPDRSLWPVQPRRLAGKDSFRRTVAQRLCGRGRTAPRLGTADTGARPFRRPAGWAGVRSQRFLPHGKTWRALVAGYSGRTSVLVAGR